MSRNVDTMSLAKKGELPEMSLLTGTIGPERRIIFRQLSISDEQLIV